MCAKSAFRSFLAPTLLALFVLPAALLGEEKTEHKNAQVSYYEQIRPIFQAHCQGCHQPAKSSGGYVMTNFQKLVAGGETGFKAVTPGKPGESYLIELIKPAKGKAEMPKGKKPLAAAEIELIEKWIAQGAKDDTPSNARQRFDMDHPPVYTLPPVITSLDFSPDGKLLAVAGFHEVLLHKADGSGLVARLVGMSERIESVRFSPDGKRLAVTGGLPGRMGEVQVWDVEKHKLKLSVPVTYDTVYGASWSPDGKVLAFGCADNTVRGIDAKSGDQIFFQGSHNDWVFDTVFSVKGTHLASVGRDRTAKLMEFETERFIDNITSITPGALTGGVNAVDRHPTKDEILVGGADGVPKIFRMFRKTKRVIGDNANLIRKFPPLKGRIFSVAVSDDGQRIAAGSSLNGAGEVRVYGYNFDTNVPGHIQKILTKRSYQRSAQEKEQLEKFRKDGVKILAATSFDKTGIYAVTFSPDGKTLAAAGSDGNVRLIDSDTGDVKTSFVPVEVTERDKVVRDIKLATPPEEDRPTETLPAGSKVVGITVTPSAIKLDRRYDSVQLVVTGKLDSGDTMDLTRLAEVQDAAGLFNIANSRLLRPKKNGQGELVIRFAGQQKAIPAEVSGVVSDFDVDFIRDVNPVLSKLGCNAGTCHGAQKGKNGFKLSLRGYDPIVDVRAFTDDLASRRTNISSPDDSLMLLKATSAVPHMGGQRTRIGEPYYEIIRRWISDGAKLNLKTPGVASIEILPQKPIIARPGLHQQMRVIATYEDGSTRDVTGEAFIKSGNTDIADHNEAGLITAVRRGEAPVLARYEGSYAATTLTVMGDRSGFVWKDFPPSNYIDELVAAKLKRMKIQPSDVCTDAEFVRRVYLDLTGLPPTADQVRKFLDDPRAAGVKRAELIDKLVGSPEFVEYWTNKWADLLQVNSKFLGAEGAKSFRNWIRQQVASNTPYDKFAYEILTASGSNKENPAASYYKILREPDAIMENTTHLFLAIRFNCNKCHDHPFERWTQDQYYETAAFFARVGLKKDPASGKKEIGKTAVEKGKPLYEVVFEKDSGEVKHERTGAVTAPEFPFECDFNAAEKSSRRERLARWITSPDNQYFAKSYVNRLWGYLLGTGIIEPLDDIRAGNPPTNPELLDALTKQFIESDFNVQDLIRTICKSRTYQLSVQTNKFNEDDTINYSHAQARRLPAEVIYDAVHHVTGSQTRLPGYPAGTRAVEIEAGTKLPSGFLDTLGRPPRESSCECERTSGLELGSVMPLISGPVVSKAISDSNNAIAKLVASEPDNRKLINELFLRIWNRPATEEEIEASVKLINEIPQQHQQLVKTLNEYEKSLQPIIAEKERKRQEAIAAAKSELEAYEKELAPKLAELDRQQKERTAKLEAELKEYEKTLPEKLAAWEAAQGSTTVWSPLDPSQLKSSFGAKFEKQDDLSVFVSGKNGKGNYQFVAHTDLKGITGIRLELLADERLPKKGPGRAPNGNFVLTEFSLEAAPKDAADQKKAVKLQNAKADFSQDNYDVKTAIDGKQPATNNGWAGSPKLGVNRTAVFELKDDLKHENGSTLTFSLDQKYADGQHTLGRFRISVTTAPRPIKLEALPENIAAILKVPANERSDEQRAELMKYYRSVDDGLKKHQQAVAESKKPRPIDPKLKKLREKLARVSQPLPVDPKLAQLKADVKTSEGQLKDQRLVAAQDIAWALINSPVFLFNH